MATATIQSVSDNARQFESKFGPMAAFDVTFTDGRKGQVVTKVDTLDRKQQQFRDLVGKETQFILEENGTWPDGNPKPLKVKLPAFGGGPGGGGGRPPRDEATIQERMDRRTAAMQATVDGVFSPDLADQIYAWLRKTAGAGETTVGEAADRPSTREAPAPVTTSAPAAGGTGTTGETTGGEGAALAAAPSAGGGGGDHIHGWRPSPNPSMASKGWVFCACGETRKGGP